MVHSPYQQQLQRNSLSVSAATAVYNLFSVSAAAAVYNLFSVSAAAAVYNSLYSTYINDRCIMYWNTLSTVYHQQLLQYVYNLIYVFAEAKV